MSIVRNAIPLVVLTGVLSGCAGLQKSDWPTCAAVGGVTGAALGAFESSSYAGWGALIAATTAGGYCWAQGQGQEVVTQVEVEEPMVPSIDPAPAETLRVELDVKFDFDRQVVKPESYADIRDVAEFMKQFPQTTTVVEGHTDAVGTEAYNQSLSERRAMAVREVLVSEFGIQPGRVDAIGFGEARPVADNDSEEGRAINRRVEAVVEARVE
ncbi:MAG TPA: OmpA family protein [Pseudomonas sp.]|uniref:OmpA family protein n=1 Tax=Pseudomonas sp. TaxID=306 RepID=UPI002B535C4A|nr:OmpA family protein [Pseudomonas sp.]HTO18371.1 OmpA family protein [Pseudomonas sp.]